MGLCAQDIASFYGMNRTAVYNIVRRLSVTTVPVKQGKPKKLNSFWVTKLEQLIVLNRFMPCHLLAVTFNLNGTVSIGVRTLQQYIHQLGFSSCHALEKPFLREQNVMKRTLWELVHYGWSTPEWARVLFADESKFLVRLEKRRVRVWRKSGERFKSDCVLPTFKSGNKSVNIRGGFSFFDRTPLYRIAENSTRRSIWSLIILQCFLQLRAYLAVCTTLYSRKTIVALIGPQLRKSILMKLVLSSCSGPPEPRP